MDSAQIAQVRSFNRVATQRAGALSDRFLGRTRPLGQARLLWEIGRVGANVRDLRARLGLDSGYLSRLLRALEAEGLVVVRPDDADARVRRAALTPRGEREWSELESRSEALAVSVLEPLSERQEHELVAAMQTVERLLTASVIAVATESPRSPAGSWCLRQYYTELSERFDAGFDPATSSLPDAGEMAPPDRPLPHRTPARRAGRLRRADPPRHRTGGDQTHVGRARGTRSRPRPSPTLRA